ncbi:MAG: alpha/beta hydrolase [Planctomycetota bacterium]|nr:alpha/beta hydrolase [Planctomycetota bacterium]
MTRILSTAVVSLLLFPAILAAELPKPTAVLDLWPDGAPDTNGLTGPEKGKRCVGNISKPTLLVYLPTGDRKPTSAVVITPGGGYGVVCVEPEGYPIAELLIERGIAAIICKYRLPNGHHLVPANDARRALRTVRHNAAKWNIDPKRVGVWGFSAGGHLASTVSTVFDSGKADSSDMVERQSSRPDFSVLFYPVITMMDGAVHKGSRKNLVGASPQPALLQRYSNENRVTKQTPPTFLLHCTDDRAVPVENSLGYYRQLVAQGVPASLLIFESGSHGPTAFNKNPSWLAAFDRWLTARGAK